MARRTNKYKNVEEVKNGITIGNTYSSQTENKTNLEKIKAFSRSIIEPYMYLICNTGCSDENKDLAYIHGMQGNREIEYLQNVSDEVKEYIEHLSDILPNQIEVPIPAMPQPGEPMVTISFSEHPDIPREPFTLPFSQANKYLGELDMQQRIMRDWKEIHGLCYYKTDFKIVFEFDGESSEYDDRYDLGDGFGSLLNIIRNSYEFVKKYFAEDKPDTIESYKQFISLLEKYEKVS